MLYKILWVIGIFVGSLVELNLIWDLADLLNGLMAIPNIFAVLLLSNVIAAETKKYSGSHINDKDETEIPVLKNAALRNLCLQRLSGTMVLYVRLL